MKVFVPYIIFHHIEMHLLVCWFILSLFFPKCILVKHLISITVNAPDQNALITDAPFFSAIWTGLLYRPLLPPLLIPRLLQSALSLHPRAVCVCFRPQFLPFPFLCPSAPPFCPSIFLGLNVDSARSLGPCGLLDGFVFDTCFRTYAHTHTHINEHSHKHTNEHAPSDLFVSKLLSCEAPGPNLVGIVRTGPPLSHRLTLSLSLSHGHAHTHIHSPTHTHAHIPWGAFVCERALR